MDERTDAPAEALAALGQLKCLLRGLRLAGLESWPRRTPDAPAQTPVKSSKPLAPAADSPQNEPEPRRTEALETVRDDLGDCERCRLHSGRNQLVFGDGAEQPELVFVGEGPGFEEDRAGKPFVGRAGKLLDKMIRAMGLRREAVYICNVVKCRPPGNRTPNPEEIEACSPFLIRQIEALRPKAVCALGACAARTLLETSRPISQLRGKVHIRRGIPLIATFHPAYLLRSPEQKAAAWRDLQDLLKILEEEKED